MHEKESLETKLGHAVAAAKKQKMLQVSNAVCRERQREA